MTAADTNADIAAVQMMMERLGLTAGDLTGARHPARVVPTFADHIPAVLAGMPEGRTREHYRTYWDKILDQPGWADRRLDEPTAAELRMLCEQIRAARIIRRSDRGGRDVVRHVVDALRRLYKHAEDSRLIDPRDNPAARLDKPKRTRSNRRALTSDLLAQIVDVAASTGNDPELDTLLLRLHSETACRRAGALALRPQDLDPVQSLILLREKGETQLWQPVSPTLMRALYCHAEESGGTATEQLLRTGGANPSRDADTTICSNDLAGSFSGSAATGSPSIGSATQLSPGSNAATARRSLKSSPATAKLEPAPPGSTRLRPSPRLLQHSPMLR
ncbi:site-specific integrase [Nocardia cyriacigeorgica]|uniref:site-specific integrase n=1 Tax=Nocardia cyriacigeorgica TaxID=135487 RepID=UPI002457FEF3|nr:site-specific integrase [Nocardia cyriacigeorgica]